MQFEQIEERVWTCGGYRIYLLHSPEIPGGFEQYRVSFKGAHIDMRRTLDSAKEAAQYHLERAEGASPSRSVLLVKTPKSEPKYKTVKCHMCKEAEAKAPDYGDGGFYRCEECAEKIVLSMTISAAKANALAKKNTKDESVKLICFLGGQIKAWAYNGNTCLSTEIAYGIHDATTVQALDHFRGLGFMAYSTKKNETYDEFWDECIIRIDWSNPPEF